MRLVCLAVCLSVILAVPAVAQTDNKWAGAGTATGLVTQTDLDAVANWSLSHLPNLPGVVERAVFEYTIAAAPTGPGMSTIAAADVTAASGAVTFFSDINATGVTVTFTAGTSAANLAAKINAEVLPTAGIGAYVSGTTVILYRADRLNVKAVGKDRTMSWTLGGGAVFNAPAPSPLTGTGEDHGFLIANPGGAFAPDQIKMKSSLTAGSYNERLYINKNLSTKDLEFDFQSTRGGGVVVEPGCTLTLTSSSPLKYGTGRYSGPGHLAIGPGATVRLSSPTLNLDAPPITSGTNVATNPPQDVFMWHPEGYTLPNAYPWNCGLVGYVELVADQTATLSDPTYRQEGNLPVGGHGLIATPTTTVVNPSGLGFVRFAPTVKSGGYALISNSTGSGSLSNLGGLAIIIDANGINRGTIVPGNEPTIAGGTYQSINMYTGSPNGDTRIPLKFTGDVTLTGLAVAPGRRAALTNERLAAAIPGYSFEAGGVNYDANPVGVGQRVRYVVQLNGRTFTLANGMHLYHNMLNSTTQRYFGAMIQTQGGTLDVGGNLVIESVNTSPEDQWDAGIMVSDATGLDGGTAGSVTQGNVYLAGNYDNCCAPVSTTSESAKGTYNVAMNMVGGSASVKTYEVGNWPGDLPGHASSPARDRDTLVAGNHSVAALNVGSSALGKDGKVQLVSNWANNTVDLTAPTDYVVGDIAALRAAEILVCGALSVQTASSELDLNGFGVDVADSATVAGLLDIHDSTLTVAGTLSVAAGGTVKVNTPTASTDVTTVAALAIDSGGWLDLASGTVHTPEGPAYTRFAGVGDQTTAWKTFKSRVKDSTPGNEDIVFEPVYVGAPTDRTYWRPKATPTGVVSADSLVTAQPATVPNLGVLASTVEVTLVDTTGAAITGATVTVNVTGSAAKSAVTELADGHYVCQIADTTAETVTVSVVANGVALTTQPQIVFYQVILDNAACTVALADGALARIPPDGLTTTTIRVMMKDTGGSGVPGIGPVLSLLANGTDTGRTFVEVGGGVYEATYASTVLGPVTLSVIYAKGLGDELTLSSTTMIVVMNPPTALDLSSGFNHDVVGTMLENSKCQAIYDYWMANPNPDNPNWLERCNNVYDGTGSLDKRIWWWYTDPLNPIGGGPTYTVDEFNSRNGHHGIEGWSHGAGCYLHDPADGTTLQPAVTTPHGTYVLGPFDAGAAALADTTVWTLPVAMNAIQVGTSRGTNGYWDISTSDVPPNDPDPTTRGYAKKVVMLPTAQQGQYEDVNFLVCGIGYGQGSGTPWVATCYAWFRIYAIYDDGTGGQETELIFHSPAIQFTGDPAQARAGAVPGPAFDITTLSAEADPGYRAVWGSGHAVTSKRWGYGGGPSYSYPTNEVGRMWEPSSVGLPTNSSKKLLGFQFEVDNGVLQPGYKEGDQVLIFAANATVATGANLSPVANAGADVVVHDTDGSGNQAAALNGSLSYDADGTIRDWVWTEGGTQIATGETAEAVLSLGWHTITLTVTDNDGGTDTDIVMVLVNVPPVANAGPDQMVFDETGSGSVVATLEGRGSRDPDGTVSTWVWSENGSTIATGSNPQVTLSLGTHTILLTVTDNSGGTHTDTVVIVATNNHPPVADAGGDRTVADDNDDGLFTASLDAGASTDSDGTITGYGWYDALGNLLASGPTAQVTLPVGINDLTLVVTDDGGATDSTVFRVWVMPTVNYWVDQKNPLASDTNPGTAALPWRTIDYAVGAVTAGDVICVREGIYRESVTPSVSGVEGQPITLMGYPGERVVISGADELTGWTQADATIARNNPNAASIFYVDIPWKPTRLVQDEVDLAVARTPLSGWWLAEGGTTNTLVDTVNLKQPNDYWNGATIFVEHLDGGVQWTREVSDYNFDTGTLTINGVWYSTMVADPGDRYYLSNKVELINSPGQWVAEDIGGGMYRLFVWPSGGGTPAGHMMEASRCGRFLIEYGAQSYWIFDNFEVRNGTSMGFGSWSSACQGHIVLQNCVFHHNDYIAISNGHNDYGTIRRNLVVYNGYGIANGAASNVLIEENEVGWNQVDGVLTTGPGGTEWAENVTLRRNYIHDHFLWGHPDNCQSYSNIRNLLIEDNFIIHAGQGYMMEATEDGIIRGNTIVGSAAVMIIYGNGNVENMTCENNTLCYSGYSVVSMAGRDGYHFKNNIVVRGAPYSVWGFWYEADLPSIYTSDYNLFWLGPGLTGNPVAWPNSATFAAYQTNSGQDTNSQFADPLFVNAPAYFSNLDGNMQDLFTNTRVYLAASEMPRFLVGDHVEIDWDGVDRVITNVSLAENWIEFTPGDPQFAMKASQITNWKDNRDFTLNFTLQPGSPASGAADDGGDLGSMINTQQFAAGDFNGDGRRDIPVMPSYSPPVGDPDADVSDVAATSPVVADGLATSTITIAVKDAAGTALSGLGGQIVVAVSGSSNALSPASGATEIGTTGVYEVTLSSTVAEVKTITVTVGSVELAIKPTVTFESPPLPELQFTAALDCDWVYPNTPTTTQDRHKSVLSVNIISGGLAEESYSIWIAQNHGPVADFRIDQPAAIVPGAVTALNVLGGHRLMSTPGSYVLNITVTGATWGQMATADVPLTLRPLGDIDGDGLVNSADKLEMNKKLNGLDTLPGITLRALDLSGDGALVNAEDKLAINQVLNGLVVP
jgi:hypothetical protein